MVHTKRHPVSHLLPSAWQERRDALQQSLESEPDSTWAWLWRVRVRVLDYLISRYGDIGALPTSKQKQYDTLIEPSSQATSSPIPPRSGAEETAEQLRLRNTARQRFAAILEDRKSLGEYVRQKADLSARRSSEESCHEQSIVKTLGLIASILTLVPLVSAILICLVYLLVVLTEWLEQTDILLRPAIFWVASGLLLLTALGLSQLQVLREARRRRNRNRSNSDC